MCKQTIVNIYLPQFVTILKSTFYKILNAVNFKCVHLVFGGSRWRSWLRHCDTSRKVTAFDSRWCHWNFLLTKSFQPHCDPGVDSASNRNEHQEYFLEGKGGRCVGLTTLPPSCADCLEIWEPQLLGTLRTCPGL